MSRIIFPVGLLSLILVISWLINLAMQQLESHMEMLILITNEMIANPAEYGLNSRVNYCSFFSNRII